MNRRNFIKTTAGVVAAAAVPGTAAVKGAVIKTGPITRVPCDAAIGDGVVVEMHSCEHRILVYWDEQGQLTTSQFDKNEIPRHLAGLLV